MGLLKILFAAIILSYPVSEIGRFQLDSGIAFTISTVLVSLFGVIWFLQSFFQNKLVSNFRSSLTKPLFIFIAICLISLLVNIKNFSYPQVLISFLYLLRWILYAFLFFAVSGFDLGFRKMIKNLTVFVGVVLVFAGYLQYFLYPSLRNLYYAGWDEHLYRMFSTFLDPNFFGAFCVLFFLLILGFFYTRPSLFYGGLLLLTLGAIFLTFSRSAIIMLIVGWVVLSILMNKKKWLFVLAASLALVFTISSKYFFIENINPFRVVSTESRLETARNAITIFADHPILGIGFNTYRFIQIRYGFREEVRALMSHADASPDNSFLFILATVGIIGSFGYGYLWLTILRKAYRAKGTLSFVIIASSLGLFVNSMFINSLFYPPLMLWMWVILGLNEKARGYK